jgi:hypothetical protein
MTGNGPLPATLVNELQVARHDTEKQGRVPSGMFAEQLNRAQRLSAACPKLSLDRAVLLVLISLSSDADRLTFGQTWSERS